MFKSISYYDKIAENVLNESQRTFSKAIINESLSAKEKYGLGGKLDELEFDIFLSHSYLDKKTVFGVYKDFESLGYNTYVDWIVDPSLDRANITKTTAEKLRLRMKQSKCLIYATSSNITGSQWMPWELGYMDGLKKSKVAVFPLLEDYEDDSDLELPKYLELYYTCSKETENRTHNEVLWINETPRKYIDFNSWLKLNKKPFIRNNRT